MRWRIAENLRQNRLTVARIVDPVDIAADPLRYRMRFGKAVSGSDQAIDEDRFGAVPDHILPGPAKAADRDRHPLDPQVLVGMAVIAMPMAVPMFVISIRH